MGTTQVNLKSYIILALLSPVITLASYLNTVTDSCTQ